MKLSLSTVLLAFQVAGAFLSLILWPSHRAVSIVLASILAASAMTGWDTSADIGSLRTRFEAKEQELDELRRVITDAEDVSYFAGELAPARVVGEMIDSIKAKKDLPAANASEIPWLIVGPAGVLDESMTPPDLGPFYDAKGYLRVFSRLDSNHPDAWGAFIVAPFRRADLSGRRSIGFVSRASSADIIRVILRDKGAQNFVDVAIRPDWTGYAIPLDSFPAVDKGRIRAIEFLRSREIGSLAFNEISLAFLGGIGGHAAVSAETLGEAAP